MLHVYWPYSCLLTMLILLGVIFVMLKHGPRLCKLRHTALPDRTEWGERAYEQQVSYA